MAEIIHNQPLQHEVPVELGKKSPDAQLRRELAQATLTIVQLQQQVEASQIDIVTGIPNRSAFDASFSRLFKRSDTEAGKLGLALVDLNNLKKINDTHGHSMGDTYLRHAAEALQYNIRPLDQAYRIGGDEFAVLLPGLNGTEEERLRTRDRIRGAVNEAISPHLPSGMGIGIAIGIGIMQMADTPERFYDRIDQQMYADKIASKIGEV